MQAWAQTLQWLIQACLLWGVVYVQTLKRLALNRLNMDAPLYAGLGWGNRVTILRGGLIAMAGGFLFQSPETIYSLWLPALFYMTAAIIDRVDGYIARRSSQVSLLGGELDTVFDALGLVVAPILAVWFGKVHWSYLSVSMAFYLFQWGLAFRQRHNKPVYTLSPNFLRRALAGFQMGFLSVALWPVIQPSVTTIAGLAFMLPMLIGFTVDWLTASGRFNRSLATFFSWLGTGGRWFFQPGLRVLLVVTMLYVVRESGVSWWAIPGTAWTEQLLSLLVLASVAMIALGLAGRLGALFLIVLLGWHFPGNADSVAGSLLIFSTVWIMLLGTGHFSLWQWDDHWVNRHDGA